MLFGFRKVPDWAHTLATLLVAAGTTLSAFWIIALNSWMHTPAGFQMIDGVAHATDWWAVVFNPSFPYRLVHMLLASGLTVAFLMAGLSAWRWLRGDRSAPVQLVLRAGILTAAALIPLQILAGDLHGLNTLEHQPAKVAAMEANWDTRDGVPLVLFALPDELTRTNRYAIELPYGASLILTHEFEGQVPGLNQFPGNHPPVAPLFFGFRIMVGLGVLMLLASWSGAFFMRWGRGPQALPAWHLKLLALMTFAGWVATLAGWYVTEIGRQPWLVTGVLSTADAVAAVPAPMVLSTLLLYLATYVLLLAAYIGVLFHLAKKDGERGPIEDERDMFPPVLAPSSVQPAE
jgi:cytochrome d ubiquinol oxidase subunit I